MIFRSKHMTSSILVKITFCRNGVVSCFIIKLFFDHYHMSYWMTSCSNSCANSCSNSYSLTNKTGTFFMNSVRFKELCGYYSNMTRLVQLNSANVNTTIPQQAFFCVTQIFFCSTQKYVFLNIRKNPWWVYKRFISAKRILWKCHAQLTWPDSLHNFLWIHPSREKLLRHVSDGFSGYYVAWSDWWWWWRWTT